MLELLLIVEEFREEAMVVLFQASLFDTKAKNNTKYILVV